MKKKVSKNKKKSFTLPTHPEFTKEHKKLSEIDLYKDNKKWNAQFRKVCRLAKKYGNK